jgi:lipopolysaccharide transport system permease protein
VPCGRYRELLYFLVWRELKIRYKQAAILQPVLTVGILVAIFGYLVRISSDGMPYPVFAFAAVLPWS